MNEFQLPKPNKNNCISHRSFYWISRLILFLVILVLGNWFYGNSSWQKDVSKHADLLDSLNNIVNVTDILMLSSSSNYFHQVDDSSKSTVSDFLQTYFPSKRINPIHKGYLHAGMFWSIIRNIPDNSPIETLVIELNLRSFSAFWLYSQVESLYSVQGLFMNPNYPSIIKRALFALDFYDNQTDEERKLQVDKVWKTSEFTLAYQFPFSTVSEWEYDIVHQNFLRKDDGSKNWYLTEKASGLIKAYAFDLSPQGEERIQSFDKILEEAKARNWNVVLVVVPIDVDKIHALLGPEIPRLLLTAQAQLKKRYEKAGVHFIEGVTALPSSLFYEEFPTEHYLSAGKAWLAEQIALQLKQTFPLDYQAVKYQLPPVFYPNEKLHSDYILQIKEDSTRQHELSMMADYHCIPYEYYMQAEITSLLRIKEAGLDSSLKILH